MKFICSSGFLLISAGILLAQDGPASAVPESLGSIFSTDSAVEPLATSTASLAFQYVVAHFPFGGGFNTQVMFANSGTKGRDGASELLESGWGIDGGAVRRPGPSKQPELYDPTKRCARAERRSIEAEFPEPGCRVGDGRVECTVERLQPVRLWAKSSEYQRRGGSAIDGCGEIVPAADHGEK